MGRSLKLVNKLKRRRKSANPGRGDRSIDKADLQDEVLADSPKAYRHLRGTQRRNDKSFGQELIASPKKVKMEKLVQVDIADSAGAATMTFTGTLLTDVGVQPGDTITVLEGALKGVQLDVATIDSATELTTETSPTTPASETGISVKIQISGSKKSFK